LNKRVLFLGSKKVGYHAFQFLIENKDSMNIDIVGLLTTTGSVLAKDHDLTSLANTAGITVYDSQDSIIGIEVDFLISVQYHLILNKQQIDVAKEIAINLHLAPLPEYRGCNQFSFAIIDDVKEYGTTIHQMEIGIDSGPIIFEDRFEMPANCTVKELYELTLEKSISLFQNSIEDLFNGRYTTTPQSSYAGKRSSGFHTRQEIHDIRKLDLSWEPEKILRYVRATNMPGFEPPYVDINGQKIFLCLDWIK